MSADNDKPQFRDELPQDGNGEDIARPPAAERTPKRATAAEPSTLAAALVAAQAEMPAVKPDATNPHFKSKFVSLDHLIALTRPVLNRHGLAISQHPARADDGMPVLRTIILHVSGETLSADAPLLPGKQDMQGLGAAITYARRYAWAAACGIASETDDDGESIAQRGTGATEKPSRGSRAAQPAVKPAEAASASEEDIAAYRAEVEEGGFAWEPALEALEADGATEEALVRHRQQLQDALASIAAAQS